VFETHYFEARLPNRRRASAKMPKQKTHKGLSKRFKITASGKVKHRRAGGSHLMSGKNAKRRRRIDSSAIMTGASADTIKSKVRG